MKFQRKILPIIIVILCFYYFILPIHALHTSPTFRLGDTSLPVDEDGFIEYDFEDSLAPAIYKLKVSFIDIHQLIGNPNVLAVNVSVFKASAESNDYEVLIADSIKYDNQSCLSCNRTEQYFLYHQPMENLLINGYGGFFIMPNEPVDINIVKGYIDAYTQWSATVEGNSITIGIDNDQVVITYNEQGFLIKEEVISGGQISSTLSIVESDQLEISFGNSFILILLGCIIGLSILYKKKLTLR